MHVKANRDQSSSSSTGNLPHNHVELLHHYLYKAR
jgi:hypothetical protein